MTKIFTQATLSILFKEAEEKYPEECCGFILIDGTVCPARNIQNELHNSDPQRYPRDAHCGYTMSVEDILLLERSFAMQISASVIYHSHPDVGAYFSNEDRDKALFCGIPVYPVSYLVIDVRNGKAVEAVLFSYLDGDFQQVQKFVAN